MSSVASVILTWSDIAEEPSENPPRYGRFREATDGWTRLAYRAVAPRHYVGGRGYHCVKRVQAWPLTWGKTAEEAAEHAGPGNIFCWMGTAKAFSSLTIFARGLPRKAIREADRKGLVALPNGSKYGVRKRQVPARKTTAA